MRTIVSAKPAHIVLAASAIAACNHADAHRQHDHSNVPIAKAPPTEPAGYHCDRCGRLIFREDEIIKRRPLWDLGDYKAPVYQLKSAWGLDGLRRYDVSLHEGWYCCRFIAMRMTVDKFGTGDSLLVYADSVKRVAAGQQVDVRRCRARWPCR